MRLRGSHRRAFVLGNIAIKLPRWGRLREAARANREEARLWREGWQRFYPELCPVIACLPFGVALVMPAVRLMNPDEFRVFCESEAYPFTIPTPSSTRASSANGAVSKAARSSSTTRCDAT